jgi:hypothetical protein
MEALFYLCSVAARSGQQSDDSGRSLFNGCLPVGLFLMVVLISLLRLFETYIFDIGGTLAACCALGPVNPKNPFSSKAIAVTYIVLPIALAMTLIFGRAVRKHLDRIEAAYRVSKVVCFLFLFIVVMSAPLGAQGNGLQPLVVLAGQGVLYAAFVLWLRFQKVQPAEMAEGGSSGGH